MFESYDFVVIGAGIAGAVVAERLAQSGGFSILVLEASCSAGGLLRSNRDHLTGIKYPIYGSRALYSDDETVIKYLMNFGSFVPYEHRVRARINDRNFVVPINLETINHALGTSFDAEEAKAFVKDDIESSAITQGTLEEAAVTSIGRSLYEMFVRGFLTKQLGADPAILSDDAFNARFPIRFDNEDRFVPAAKWQMLPKNGFDDLIDQLLASSRIDVRFDVGADTFATAKRLSRIGVVHSGSVDALFNQQFGPLEYGENIVCWKHSKPADVQHFPVVTYPDFETPYFRTHAPAYLPNSMADPKAEKILVGYEMSANAAIPDFLSGCPAYRYRYLAKSLENKRRHAVYTSLVSEMSGVYALGRHMIPSPNIGASVGIALETVERIRHSV